MHVQSLLQDWQQLLGGVQPLMANATHNADATAAAAAVMAAAAGETLVASREAAAWSSRLTEQYVAEAALVQTVTDMQDGAVACDRALTGTYAGHFTLAAYSSTSGGASNNSSSNSRRLLAGGAEAMTGQVESWEGYLLDQQPSEGGWGLEAAGVDTPEQQRWLGAAGSNRMVGGLFLHTTRRAPQLHCSGSSFAVQYALRCSKAAVPLLREGAAGSVSQVANYLAELFAGAGNDIYPYGVDPVFLRSSSLYRPELLGNEGDYYNTSDPAEVPPATGTPYGFFHRDLQVCGLTVCPSVQLLFRQPMLDNQPLTARSGPPGGAGVELGVGCATPATDTCVWPAAAQGYPAGFPVLLPAAVSNDRVRQLVDFLMDGNYLDAAGSRQLTAELLSFNPNLRVLGYLQLQFAWQAHGAITGVWTSCRRGALPRVLFVRAALSCKPSCWVHTHHTLCILF